MADLSQAQLAQLQIVQELELEMVADLYNRMTMACHKKCIPPTYREGELAKGEAVCIDRCVAKYLDVHERVGKKISDLSTRDVDFMKNMQSEQPKS